MLLNINARDFRANPYPYFKQFRQKAPICRTQPHACWAVFKYQDVQRILKQDHLFSSILSEQQLDEHDPQFLLFARSLVGMDRPNHCQLRKRLSKSFMPGMISQLDQDIELICHNLVKKIPTQQVVDFSETVAKPLPIIVLLRLLGIDGNYVGDMKRWIEWLLSWRNQKQQSLIKSDIKQMHTFFNLGRLQVRKALTVIIEQFTSIKLHRQQPTQYLPTLIFRSLKHLPMVFG